MAGSKLQGLAEANSLFDQLPGDAEEQLGVELAIIGREILADQRRLAPVDTGTLEADLSLALLRDQLKVRVGLMLQGRKKYGGKRRGGASARDTYYGRFVALGRDAQTVVVTRKVKLKKLKGNNRRDNTRRTQFTGNTTRLRRRGPNRGTPIGSPYKMRVPFKAARDFIRVPGAEETAIGQLAEFWSRLLDRRGTGA